MRTFVLGDPHGAFKAIRQVLLAADFDYENDRLIVLGDIADGWKDVPNAIETLLKIKNLIYVLGNHDMWLMHWLEFGVRSNGWYEQGGQASIEAYLEHPDFPLISHKHLKFLKKCSHYFVDEKNRLYVHGGYRVGKPIEETDLRYATWDRDLWCMRNNSDMKRKTMMQFEKIFVGHTSIWAYSHRPIFYGNTWFMDTGGGYEGALSMMNVDTEEVFQSVPVKELYPDQRGRN